MRMGDQTIADKIKNRVVLDLGSGIKSIQFLINSKAKKIFAVSFDEKELNDIKHSFPNAKNINYLNIDVTKKFEIPEKVDVIIAALFFSALEGSRPNSSLTVINKVKKYLKPKGILFVEDFYWENNLTKEEDILGMEIEEIRNKVRDEAKVSYPKQISEQNLLEIINKANFKIKDVTYRHDNKVWNEEKKGSLEKQFKSIRKHSEKISNFKKKQELVTKAAETHNKLLKMEEAPAYTYLYLIEATF